jgi:anhydro-N-acetylmuramic acid kinase
MRFSRTATGWARSSSSPVALSDLSWLDSKVTQLLAECAKTVMAQVPRGLKKPHLIVLSELSLHRGPTGDSGPLGVWNASIGDPQYLATAMNTPVISELSRYHIFAGGRGAVPTVAGDLIMAKRFGNIVAFLNIGLIAHLAVVDVRTPQRCIINSDTGPGMCLINRVARDSNCPDGFDRDGSLAANGTVNAACLDSLVNAPWFLADGPKEAASDQFTPLLQKPDLATLEPQDRLATITALTARTAYDFFRHAWKENSLPEVMVVSGGGANNRALNNYLATYFGHLPITGCEKCAIPPELCFPLATGLSLDSFLSGQATVWEDGVLPRRELAGRVSIP